MQPIYASGDADSLQKVISSLPENEERADALQELGRVMYKAYQYDSAYLFYDQSAMLSKKLGYDQGLADAWYWKSVIKYSIHEFEVAQIYIDDFLDICITLQDSTRLARGYFHQARIYKNQSQPNLALHYTRKSLAMYLPMNHPTGIYANYNVLAGIFVRISEYDSAAVYYLKGVEICESEGNQKHLATLYGNLVEVFLQTEQYDEAQKYAEMALAIEEKQPEDPGSLASRYMDLGRIAAVQDIFVEALGYYDLAMENFKKAQDQISVYHVKNNYGDLFFRQEKYDLAIEYFDQALKGYMSMNDLHGIVTALGNKASALSESGNDYEASKLYDSCLNISFREGNRELRKDLYLNIADLSWDMGDYKRAYEYLLLYSELKDSIFSLNKTELINELEILYEKEKILAQNKILENENLRKDLSIRKKTSQRNAILYSGIGIIALAVFIILYFRQRAAKDRIIAEQKILQLEEEKRLMAARLLVEGQEEERKRIAQELHDGLGVLLSATKMQFTSIKDLSPESKPVVEKATQMLEQATGDVRKISHNMMPGLLTKMGLNEALEELFDNLNETEELTATYEITGELKERLPENKEIMLYRIIQELVNNTLKHAKAYNISLKINVFPGMLHIKFSDDGKGFDVEETLESGTRAFGLRNLESRVSFLNGEMNIQSEPGKGVIYIIQVPV
jgi:signal transduction histidine kinase/Tfp pilus assembly protein PilF